MKTLLLIVCAGLLCMQACKKDDGENLNFNSSNNPDAVNASLLGWTQVSSFPSGGRIGAFGFSIGNKGYAGTGFASDSTAGDFWEYDPVNNSWSRKPDFPGGNRAHATSFSIGNKGYVVLGLSTGGPQGNQFAMDLWEYDSETSTWTKKADFPTKPFAINASTAFSIGNRGYVGISCGDLQLYEYNPDTNRWTKKAGFPGGNRFGTVGFSVAGKGYIGLGVLKSNTGGPDVLMSDIWEFNPSTNTWIRKADFSGGPRGEAVAFSIQDKGYVTGGVGELGNFQTGLRNDLWEYDPVNDSWALQDINEYPARSEAVGFSIGNSGFTGLGFNLTGYQSDFWKFTVE